MGIVSWGGISRRLGRELPGCAHQGQTRSLLLHEFLITGEGEMDCPRTLKLISEARQDGSAPRELRSNRDRDGVVQRHAPRIRNGSIDRSQI